MPRERGEARHALGSREVNFEKWQALGNDYVILDERAMPFELTASGSGGCVTRTTGSAATGSCCCRSHERPPGWTGFVAKMRIFNPDGSEAELSGNGAREAILYLRRRLDRAGQFSIQTRAGEIDATITSATTCKVKWAARV